MATRPLSPGLVRPIGARPATILALALPPLFLHAEHQPALSFGLGGTTVDVRLSDVAVLAVLVAAALQARRHGLDALRPALVLWAAAAGLCLWVAAAALYGPAVLPDYPFAENVVTAAKFVEYALLAPAVALLVRDDRDLGPAVPVLIGWCALAGLVGVLQLAGLDLFDVSEPGRQRSFLGHHDFAALGGAALLVGLASLVLESVRRRVALAAGALAMILAAPLAGVVGLGLAVGGLLVVARRIRPYPTRRALAAAGAVAVVALGTAVMRSETITDFLDFLREDEPTAEIESYSHRTVLAYIGLRVFLDHPVAGVGLRGSEEPAAFTPYLADARRRFPDASPSAFPAPDRKYGIQSLYLQALADLGLVGFGLLLALLAAAIALARRALASEAGVLGLLWLLLCVGLWAAQGLVAGLPLDALTWISLGLLAAGAARR